MGSYRQLEYTRVENIGFRIYTPEEIRRISQVEVTNDESLNELGHILPNGLYDLRMGESCALPAHNMRSREFFTKNKFRLPVILFDWVLTMYMLWLGYCIC